MGIKTRFAGTYDEIEDLASELRQMVEDESEHADRGPRALLEWTVDTYGGRIEVAKEPSTYELEGASLIIRGRQDFIIRLSPHTSPLRDNFTIAHELGHYFLHYDPEAPVPDNRLVVFYRYGSDEFEWQANRFAAAFLMPKDEFVRLHKKYGGNAGLLAGHFQVSRPAVEVRASYIIK